MHPAPRHNLHTEHIYFPDYAMHYSVPDKATSPVYNNQLPFAIYEVQAPCRLYARDTFREPYSPDDQKIPEKDTLHPARQKIKL